MDIQSCTEAVPREIPIEPNSVADIFDNGGGWYLASVELCLRKNLYPNLLAYNEARATLALIVKRSTTGQDFALSEAGLTYLEATLNNGTLKDGRPVREGYVVLAERDGQKTNAPLKVITYSTAQETRQRVDSLGPAYSGRTGSYWWLTAPRDEDSAF